METTFKYIITFCSNFIGGGEKKVGCQGDSLLNLLREDAKQGGKTPTLSPTRK